MLPQQVDRPCNIFCSLFVIAHDKLCGADIIAGNGAASLGEAGRSVHRFPTVSHSFSTPPLCMQFATLRTKCKIWGASQIDLMSDQQLTNTKQWLRERRSQRIELTVPVVVHRPQKGGSQFYERTQTLVVNAHGALMVLAEKVAPKQRLLMQNISSGEQKECRVVYVEKEPTGPTKVAVEFTQPAATFWRIAYPPANWTAST